MNTVLVVHPSLHFRQSISRTLLVEMDLHTAANVTEAVELLTRIPLDVICLCCDDPTQWWPLFQVAAACCPAPDIILESSDMPLVCDLYNQGKIRKVLPTGSGVGEYYRQIHTTLLEREKRLRDRRERLQTQRSLMDLIREIDDPFQIKLYLSEVPVRCEQLADLLDIQLSWCEQLAIQLTPSAFCLLAKDEIQQLRTFQSTDQFRKAIRRAFQSLSAALTPMPRLDATAEILAHCPFASASLDQPAGQGELSHLESDGNTNRPEHCADMLHATVVWCLLKQLPIPMDQAEQWFDNYLPLAHPDLRDFLFAAPPIVETEATIPLCELRPGMMILQELRFKGGNLVVAAGRRISEAIFEQIREEVRHNQSKTVLVAADHIAASPGQLQEVSVFATNVLAASGHSSCRIHTRRPLL